jgi:hypothetical protein
MTTSRTTFRLSNPSGVEKLPIGTLSYIRSHTKAKVLTTILEELERSGVSQTELAKRIDKDEAQVSRFLGSPSNSTLDTVSDFLYGIAGAVIKDIVLEYPNKELVKQPEPPQTNTASTADEGDQIARQQITSTSSSEGAQVEELAL